MRSTADSAELALENDADSTGFGSIDIESESWEQRDKHHDAEDCSLPVGLDDPADESISDLIFNLDVVHHSAVEKGVRAMHVTDIGKELAW